MQAKLTKCRLESYNERQYNRNRTWSLRQAIKIAIVPCTWPSRKMI